MKPLKVSRFIDRLVYDDFKTSSVYKTIFDFLFDKDIKTIIDIGASSGIATLLFLELLDVERIYCIEPDKENYELLIKNTCDYRDIVDTYNIGIYYGVTSANVVGTGDESPLGYMVENATVEHNYPGGTILYKDKKFKLSPLEKVIKIPVDFIKMDVEGSEYNIVKNSRSINTTRILLISFHNHRREYVEEFIKKELPNHKIILLEQWGEIHSEILMERKK